MQAPTKSVGIVEWGWAHNGMSKSEAGDPKSLPSAGLVVAGNTGVMVEAEYDYTPLLLNLIPAVSTTRSYVDTVVNAPREARQVDLSPTTRPTCGHLKAMRAAARRSSLPHFHRGGFMPPGMDFIPVALAESPSGQPSGGAILPTHLSSVFVLRKLFTRIGTLSAGARALKSLNGKIVFKELIDGSPVAAHLG
jgi:hypothetical protein